MANLEDLQLEVDRLRKKVRRLCQELTPLSNNVSLSSGESIEILSAKQIHTGTEGAVVLS